MLDRKFDQNTREERLFFSLASGTLRLRRLIIIIVDDFDLELMPDMRASLYASHFFFFLLNRVARSTNPHLEFWRPAPLLTTIGCSNKV
jgi:hypothetical protein